MPIERMNGSPSPGLLRRMRDRRQVLRALGIVAGTALVADAAFLMTQRVFSLGVTLPLAIGLALLFLGVFRDAVHAWIVRAPWRSRLWRWTWAAFWVWVASVAAFWGLLARAGPGADAALASPPAAIVVLGSGTPGAKAPPPLAARLDAALGRARAHENALVVVSGGVDFGEVVSEAQVMGDYLRAQGLAPDRILQEEHSTSTTENLRFSRDLLAQRGIPVARRPIEVVTSDFHTLRAGWIAVQTGYAEVRTVGAPTPLYLRFNAWLREYFAVAAGFALGEFRPARP